MFVCVYFIITLCSCLYKPWNMFNMLMHDTIYNVHECTYYCCQLRVRTYYIRYLLNVRTNIQLCNLLKKKNCYLITPISRVQTCSCLMFKHVIGEMWRTRAQHSNIQWYCTRFAPDTYDNNPLFSWFE